MLDGHIETSLNALMKLSDADVPTKVTGYWLEQAMVEMLLSRCKLNLYP